MYCYCISKIIAPAKKTKKKARQEARLGLYKEILCKKKKKINPSLLVCYIKLKEE